MKKIIFLSIIFLLFLGYSPYQELNDLAVVDTLGIEVENNKYKLYLNVVNLDNKVYEVTGDSLGEVFYKARNLDEKKTYYNHLNIIILNTNVLDEDNLLTFLKDEFTNIDYLTLGTNASLASSFKDYHVSSDYQVFIKQEMEEDGSITNLTFKDLLSNDLDEVKTSYIPLIDYQDTLSSEGLYLIDKDYYVSKEIARASYLVSNKIDSYTTKIIIDNNYYQVFLYDLKTTINYKDNKLKLTVTGKIDSPDHEDLTTIKKIVINELTDDIKELIEMEITNKVSISNIINYIYLKEKDDLFIKYQDCDKKIIIDLDSKEKNNYD